MLLEFPMTVARRTFLKQVASGVAGLVLAAPAGLAWAEASSAKPFPRSRPETQGVDPAGVLRFVEEIERRKLSLHSLMIIRHGHVVAEGWWAPYAPQLRHTLYSLSKSFASTAVGLAAAEGKLSLDDKVIKFFPKELPATIPPNLEKIQVKHLLMMGSGHNDDAIFSGGYAIDRDDWVKSALSRPVQHEPGTFFKYNSGATFLLSAIVQTATGEDLVTYLKPRLFEPLGIEGADWETNPQGIATGGWGLRVRTEDIARLGQLYLQKGKWQGKQLLPESWVAEATSRQIDNAPGADEAKLKTSDWAQGYGYQFWRSRHNAYRGDGAFGQFCLVMPDQDAVVAITSEAGNMQGILDALWDTVLPAMKADTLPLDDAAAAALATKLKSLTLPLPEGKPDSPTAAKISGKTFSIADNPLKVSRVSFAIDGKDCTFTITDAAGSHPIVCGLGEWRSGTSDLSTVPLKLVATAVPGETTSKIAAAAAWSAEDTLQLQWRFIETAHYDTATCRFKEDGVELEFRRSLAVINPSAKDPRPVLKGKLK